MFWRIGPLLDKDLEINEISDFFLSNGLVNTFPWKQDAHNNAVTMEVGVFSMWAVLRS
jgi:hypothetical protein